MRSAMILMLIAAVAIVGCANNGNSDEPRTLKFDTTVAGATFSVETQFFEKDTTKHIDCGYGYFVSINGKKLINQTWIPVVEGYNRFATAEDALNTGKVVVGKMLRSADLPSLEKDDLIKLGILKPDGSLNTRK